MKLSDACCPVCGDCFATDDTLTLGSVSVMNQPPRKWIVLLHSRCTAEAREQREQPRTIDFGDDA